MKSFTLNLIKSAILLHGICELIGTPHHGIIPVSYTHLLDSDVEKDRLHGFLRAMQAAPDVKYWVNNGKTSSPRTALRRLSSSSRPTLVLPLC